MRASTAQSVLGTLGVPLLLLGCGGNTASAPVGSGGDGGASHSQNWPQTIVLHGTIGQGEGLRLADAVVGTGGAPDLKLQQSKVILLTAATPDAICELGKRDSLAQVPSDPGDCPGSWSGGLQLGATFVHELADSYVIGQSALVKDAGHTTVYRLRVLGDSYDAQGYASAMLEYEPIP